MQAVILASGNNSRLYPITLTRPKALLPLANETIIEHNLNQLLGIVKEAIVVVGNNREQIINIIGNSYKGLKITYKVQKENLGSGDALLAAKDSLKGKFIVMNGDDLFHRKDIEKLLKHDFCLLAKQVSNPGLYGVIEVEKDKILRLIEKPKVPPSNLINTGLYLFDTRIFDYELKISPRGEYEIIDYVSYVIDKFGFNYEIIDNYWLPINYPWQYLDAIEFLFSSIEQDVQGIIEEGVNIKGHLILGKGSVIKSGVYIEGNVIIGSNCTIGPNAFIRGTTLIGDNVKIGNAVEIKNSVVLSGSSIGHLAYVGDSIIGRGVNFGAGTKIANLRHGGENVKVLIKEKLVDSGRKKFGAVIGDNAKLGVNTSIYPGRMIWPGLSTKPGEVVIKNLK